MSYFLLPINNNDIDIDDINMITTHEYSDESKQFISKTLNKYIHKNKSNIENVQEEWDNIKKYVNPYEFIHTNVPYSKLSIAKYKPISRSYFKFIELSNILQLFDTFVNINITSFHLAEGPGGFIEAIANSRNNSKDIYYGMTLLSKDNNIPGWKKSKDILEKYSNIFLENGITNTGNILLPDNYTYCIDKYKNSMEIITGDGGFDFSINFNKQELLSTRLIIAEILYALALQKQGGHFILKIFDSFTKPTVELLYLLTIFYDKVYIVKPNTSRYANSERYIVCKKFKYVSTTIFFNKFTSIIKDLGNSEKHIESILTFSLPYLFISKIEEINAIIGQQQIENIVATLNLIYHKNRNDKLEQLKNNNINKCINWCIKNKQAYNKIIQPSNIFISL
jgi:cap1 methyltransferase|tara:strand:+ start:4036 stop:5220 length:1185 start_codon:yes stop_codon:yes gene_type:complete